MDAAILHALQTGSTSKKKAAKPKALKEIHVKEQHDGKFHVVRRSGKPNEQPVEHTAADMNEVHQAVEDHLGQPNQGEAEAEAPQLGEGQPGMGGELA